ncbi:MAG TPA: FAD-dependent oxidoreductase [Nitrososphaera sp.]|nr:FAD-dependent oxidoreductase [Nitrososphaera sp.]
MKVEPDRVGQFPFRKAPPDGRKSNFEEVQQPYSEDQVMREADRCLLCGTPVCIDACPVLLDVRGMNEAVARGDFKTAYDRIRETNPLLGVTGRCCPQLQGLCEDACVLKWSGQPIGIGLIQRYVADWERKNSQPAPSMAAHETGKKIAVIGAGPAGVAAADLLRRYGHRVVVYESLSTPGGTAWYGIPDYHLPKDVLLHEIDKVREMGVEIKSGTIVGKDVTLTELLDDNDAALVTTGSKDVKKLDIPGADLRGVINGYEFLERIFVDGVGNYLQSPKYDLGNQIVVVGGGDSALDCARTALRLTGGKGDVTIAYRRAEEDMPADPIMIEEAQEEGVKFRFLAQPARVEGSGDAIAAAVMDSMRLGEPDKSGRSHPEKIPGKEFRMPCSALILAIGRGPDSFLQKKAGLKLGKHDSIEINDNYGTSMDRVFAAGDVTSGETLVVKAMESGREAAQRVHEYLMGLEDQHISFYERYYKQNLYNTMLEGKVRTDLPPD